MLQCIGHFCNKLSVRLNGVLEIMSLFKLLEAKSLVPATQEELNASTPKPMVFYDKLPDSTLLIKVPRLRRHLNAVDNDLDEASHWAALDFLASIAT